MKGDYFSNTESAFRIALSGGWADELPGLVAPGEDPDEFAILLVDSEEPVVEQNPWEHVQRRRLGVPWL
jgi:hypothetical protein